MALSFENYCTSKTLNSDGNIEEISPCMVLLCPNFLFLQISNDVQNSYTYKLDIAADIFHMLSHTNQFHWGVHLLGMLPPPQKHVISINT